MLFIGEEFTQIPVAPSCEGCETTTLEALEVHRSTLIYTIELRVPGTSGPRITENTDNYWSYIFP